MDPNVLTGYAESFNMNDVTFKEQFSAFEHGGKALDPTDGGGSVKRLNVDLKGRPLPPGSKPVVPIVNKDTESTSKRKGKRPRGNWDPSSDSFEGPWARHEQQEPTLAPEEIEYQKELEQKVSDRKKQKEEEKERNRKEREANKSEVSVPGVIPNLEETTIFHLKSTTDYQNRSFIVPPAGMKAVEHECFLPKKVIHEWSGHAKGVSAIRFFPEYGHLLLSAGMDGKTKIWDTTGNHKYKCLRTYLGHQKAIRDIQFYPDGTHFLSCAYDRYLKLWDTETGQCTGRFTNDKTIYSIAVHPEHNNVVLAAAQDKKIYEWDTRQGSITQEYDRHLASVNTVTFFDEGRRMISTSDDKSLRVWEYPLAVDTKVIREPWMHSMPAVAVHPDGEWMICQSMDNQMYVYSLGEGVKLFKRKVFRGHSVSGYACKPSFSPDGQWVVSGDASGKVCFWEWKNGRMREKYRGHDGVCINAMWHPIEPSKVATCGWDGTIKYWD